MLAAQFLLFIELFATMTLFAGIALIVVLVAGSSAEKTRAVNLLPTVALSYAIALAALSPLFYCMVALGYEPGAPHPPLLYSTDLLNLRDPDFHDGAWPRGFRCARSRGTFSAISSRPAAISAFP